MRKVPSLALVLLLAGCGGATAEGPRTVAVEFGDPGDDRLGFATPRAIIVRDDLLLFDTIRVLRHELMHVAGMSGHPTDIEPCVANGNAAFWPDDPCQSDLEIMEANLPGNPVELVVSDPLLFGPTQEAATFWNEALDREAFTVVLVD